MKTIKFNLPAPVDIGYIEQYLSRTTSTLTIDRNEYERQLKERQEQHLSRFKQNWRPCLHDQCTSCHGTGIDGNGRSCIHMISCPCPKCSPSC